ncbi:kinase domain-containing protein [Plectosphaerella plurivora]|uniref:Kinase domain-containing protein n=1 Tax=Plectosphaerella plurivora TaxID=936078 RepID=A0A9P9A9D9_9PEZI|nr:kinase domain-containing protein [Plectosphaerella plurivora]
MVQWWDEAKINVTVTRQYVCNQLRPDQLARLDMSMAFGDGLTDGTYWEWIDEKAKRIFLILVDIGVPEQIFAVIDDSWEDPDLPVAQDQVERLPLGPGRDDRLRKRFFQRQHHYIMKPLRRGDHIAYADHDVLPLEIVDRRPGLGGGGSHAVDKVILPNCPGQVFCRRRVPLAPAGPGTGVPGSFTPDDFLDAVNSIRGIQNQHLVSYHASYTYHGAGYALFTPAADSSLKAFLGTTPSTFKNASKEDRRHRVVNWMLCLVDTLAYIHSRRLSHGNIKPSTILLNGQLHIFYSDFTRLNAESLGGITDRSAFDRESYDYAAPEQWFRPHTGPSSHGSMARRPTFSMSTSPETHTNFAIPRSDNPSSPNAMLHSPNPQLNPQAADVFSLGCVLLEMVGFLLKKSTKSFATHRASKNKTAGRGGAVPDSSFHKNLGQLESWMSTLAKEASKKTSTSDGAGVFRGVVPLLHVLAHMLSAHPNDRPTADEVQQRVYQIVTQHCGIAEPHCVHRYGGPDYGMANLRVQHQQGFDPNMGGLHRQNTASSWSTRDSGSFSPRAMTRSRTNSSGALSSHSGMSSSTGSERGQEQDLGSSAGSISVVSGSGFAALRNIRVPNVRSPGPGPGPGPWQASPPNGDNTVYGNQASVY